MMNRKEKLAIRQHQSTRQLMGIQRITPHGVTTARGELVFFLIRPDNLTLPIVLVCRRMASTDCGTVTARCAISPRRFGR